MRMSRAREVRRGWSPGAAALSPAERSGRGYRSEPASAKPELRRDGSRFVSAEVSTSRSGAGLRRTRIVSDVVRGLGRVPGMSNDLVELAGQAYVYGFPLVFDLEQVQRFSEHGMG